MGCLVLQNAGEGLSDQAGFGAKTFSHFGAGCDVLGQAWAAGGNLSNADCQRGFFPRAPINDPPVLGITGVQAGRRV